MHKTIVAAAVALLTSAGACLAQPPGITRDMIERALKAGAMFVGKNCSLCTNSNWDVRQKGIK